MLHRHVSSAAQNWQTWLLWGPFTFSNLVGGCRLEEAEEEQRVASWKPQSDDGHTYLQDIKTKLGQATAQNKNKHWSCLSKMEISDVREMFADWHWSVLLSAGFTVQNLDNELRLLAVH